MAFFSKGRNYWRAIEYGKKRMHLARRAAHPLGWETVECFLYGQQVSKTIKTFLATYRPADGVIRVVIVKEEKGCQFFFATDPRGPRRGRFSKPSPTVRPSSRTFTT